MASSPFLTVPLSLADLEAYFTATLAECRFLRRELRGYIGLQDARMKPSAVVSVNFNRLEPYFLSLLEHLKWRTSDLSIDESFGISDHPAAKAIRAVEYQHSGVAHPIGEHHIRAMLRPLMELIEQLELLAQAVRAKRLRSVFLCHSKNDKEFARRLAADLTRAGARVWLDEAEIKVGDSLVKKIGDGLMEMEFVGIVLSPDSVASEWVQRELATALKLEIDERCVKALPILLRDCAIPPLLADKLYADFRDPTNYAAALEKVIAALKR